MINSLIFAIFIVNTLSITLSLVNTSIIPTLIVNDLTALLYLANTLMTNTYSEYSNDTVFSCKFFNECIYFLKYSNDTSVSCYCVWFVWGFSPYQQYFSYLTATVHKSMFPRLFLISSQPVHYPDTSGPISIILNTQG